MQKKIITNLALLFAINILIKPAWILLIDRGVQNHLGYEVYGQYVSIFSLSLVLTMLLDFGINNYNSSRIAQSPEQLTSQFSKLFQLKLLLSLLYLILTGILAYVYGFRSTTWYWVLLLGFNQVLAHFSTFFRSSLSGLQLFKTDAWLSAADRLFMLILGALMLSGIGFETGIQEFILIQTAGYAGVALLSFSIVYPRLHGFRVVFNWSVIKEVISKTYPYALLALVMLLYTRTDVLFIKKMWADGDAENGRYASGGRLLEASIMMIGASTALLLPLFARMLGERKQFHDVTHLLWIILILPAATFSVWCSLYSHEVLQLISPGTTAYTGQLFSILILSIIPYTFMYVFGSMLTAKAEMRALIRICTLALVFNLLLNVWVIPRYGAWGAALTALFTQVIVGFGKMVAAYQKLPITVKPGTIWKYLFYVPAVYGIMYTLQHFQTGMGVTAIAGIVFFMAWITGTRMVELQKLGSQLKGLFQRDNS